jgi:hypothetical protein
LYRKRKFYIKSLAIFFLVIAVAVAFLLLKPLLERTRGVAVGDFLKYVEDDSSFRDFSYTMYTKDKKKIILKSDKVAEIKKNCYIFKNLESTLSLLNGDIISIFADTTKTINESKTKSQLYGNVRLFTKSGLSMKTEKAFVDFDKKIVLGDDAIAIKLSPASTGHKQQRKIILNGKKFLFDLDKNTLTIFEMAKGIVDSSSISSGSIVICFDDIREGTIKRIEAKKNPIFTTKDYTVMAKDDVVYCPMEVSAHGDVVFNYYRDDKNLRIQSENFTALIDGTGNIYNVVTNSAFTARTPSAIIMADRGFFSHNQISAVGNVVVVSDDGSVFGESAVFDIPSGELQLSKSSGVVSKKSFDQLGTK